jgi:lipopolysaccharide export system permease protein
VKILTHHILASFVMALVSSVLVITCVISIGGIFKLSDLVASGAPWRPMVQIFFLSLPQSLSYSIPMSTIVATLLVFNRLSADCELTAMKACGISLWQAARGSVLFAGLLAMLCFAIHGAVVPWSHTALRGIMLLLRNVDPLTLLEEGRFVKLTPTLTVYVGQRQENVIRTVRIYEQMASGNTREIRAVEGTVTRTADGDGIRLDLSDVRIDPLSEDLPGAAQCAAWSLTLDVGRQRRSYSMKPVDYSHAELVDRIRRTAHYFPQLNAADLREQRCTFRVAFHERLALSLICIPFVLLGIPLAASGQRHDSWKGFSLAFACTLIFYLFIITADSLTKHPEFFPHLIAWVPIVVGVLLGIILIRRHN